MNKKKKKTHIIPFLFIYAILILYLQCHTSYCFKEMNSTIFTLYDDLIISIKNNPFNVFYFHKEALWWWAVYILSILILIKPNKPKADEKWRDIEHGSNDFQNKEEIDDFLKNNTDDIIPFSDEEFIMVHNGNKRSIK